MNHFRLALISAMKMFSATVTSGQSAISWWTKPMPSSCARAGEVISTGLAVQDDLAAVGPQDAVDDVHQRRFSGAVLAGDRVHLAAAQLEVDAAQRLDRAERLADVRDLEDDVVGHDQRLRTAAHRGRLCDARRPRETAGGAARPQPRPSM